MKDIQLEKKIKGNENRKLSIKTKINSVDSKDNFFYPASFVKRFFKTGRMENKRKNIK